MDVQLPKTIMREFYAIKTRRIDGGICVYECVCALNFI